MDILSEEHVDLVLERDNIIHNIRICNLGGSMDEFLSLQDKLKEINKKLGLCFLKYSNK